MTNDRSDFTQGNILKKLVSFMMPILGALILQAAQQPSTLKGHYRRNPKCWKWQNCLSVPS